MSIPEDHRPYPLPVRIFANIFAITVVFVIPAWALGVAVRHVGRLVGRRSQSSAVVDPG